MKNISIIAAVANNNVIGKNNKLICYIPEDLKRFKKITRGHTVIMGKNTYYSLPIRPLPERKNIVISDDKKDKFPGCIMVYSIEEALEKCDEKKETFIIGGAMIYKQFIKYADKMYITRIYENFEGDTFFPEINYNEWKIIEKQDFQKSNTNPYNYSFIIYQRI